jgi:hypothetical protein
MINTATRNRNNDFKARWDRVEIAPQAVKEDGPEGRRGAIEEKLKKARISSVISVRRKDHLMNCEQELGYRPMHEAPKDREIFISANMSPFDETPFITKARFNAERGGFVVKDEPLHGMPSLGLISVNALAWLNFM